MKPTGNKNIDKAIQPTENPTGSDMANAGDAYGIDRESNGIFDSFGPDDFMPYLNRVIEDRHRALPNKKPPRKKK